MGITTCRNGPERTETDFYRYRNGLEQTSAHTETNFSENQKRYGEVR